MKNGTVLGLCNEPFCKNRRRKDRYRCHKCESRRKRKRHPVWAAWRALKDHAAARGIPFTISLEYFRQFAVQSKYLLRKGNTAGSLTVDRRNNLRGYVRGNIQAMTRARNSEKQAKQDAIRMKAGYAWQENGHDENHSCNGQA